MIRASPSLCLCCAANFVTHETLSAQSPTAMIIAICWGIGMYPGPMLTPYDVRKGGPQGSEQREQVDCIESGSNT